MAGAELSYGYSSMEKQLFKEKKIVFDQLSYLHLWSLDPISFHGKSKRLRMFIPHDFVYFDPNFWKLDVDQPIISGDV